ncbi:MAG: hypothetical protein AAB473_00880 [Patescibacteria group bacterium]
MIRILFGIALTIVLPCIAVLVYLETLSPAQLFINDTDSAVNEYLIGGTSPGIHLNVAPGKSQLVDMPSWWGTPTLPRAEDGERMQPRWNFGVFETYYLSDFPKNW